MEDLASKPVKCDICNQIPPIYCACTETELDGDVGESSQSSGDSQEVIRKEEERPYAKLLAETEEMLVASAKFREKLRLDGIERNKFFDDKLERLNELEQGMKAVRIAYQNGTLTPQMVFFKMRPSVEELEENMAKLMKSEETTNVETPDPEQKQVNRQVDTKD